MIRQLIAVSIIVTAASACESKTNPTYEEDTVRLAAAMTAAQEVPPVTGPEANATGTANITVNLSRNSNGVITGANIEFNVTLAGFPAGTPIISAHIHPGFAGNIGGITVNTGLTSGELTLTNGSGNFSRVVNNVGADVAASIVANPQGFYFNVHSQANSGGAVRGQLTLQ